MDRQAINFTRKLCLQPFFTATAEVMVLPSAVLAPTAIVDNTVVPATKSVKSMACPLLSPVRRKVRAITNWYKLYGKAESHHRPVEPAYMDFEELLLRLQREGYIIKPGKYMTCRISNQERFTRLKTLDIDYAEESIIARIKGTSCPSWKLKQRDDRIKLLMGIQGKQGVGLIYLSCKI